jgi:hypothetical protein
MVPVVWVGDVGNGDFFVKDFNALVSYWDKWLNRVGDYTEK